MLLVAPCAPCGLFEVVALVPLSLVGFLGAPAGSLSGVLKACKPPPPLTLAASMRPFVEYAAELAASVTDGFISCVRAAASFCESGEVTSKTVTGGV